MKTINNIKFIYVVLFIVLISSICCSKKLERDYILENKFNKIFQSSIQTNQMLIFSIDTITNFSWDTFFILPPYARLNLLSDSMNIDFTILKSTNIESSDKKSILVFIKDNRIIKYIEHQRYNGDFSYIGLKAYIPDSANFKLVKSNRRTQNGNNIFIVEEY